MLSNELPEPVSNVVYVQKLIEKHTLMCFKQKNATKYDRLPLNSSVYTKFDLETCFLKNLDISISSVAALYILKSSVLERSKRLKCQIVSF